MAKSSVSMKLLIDKSKGKRVLFAEAGKDCVDFLFHILSLPIATVVRLLQSQEMEGSLPVLYQSLETLSHTYILPTASKAAFLNPAPPLPSPLLALSHASAHEKKTFYGCSNTRNNNYNYCDDYDDTNVRKKCSEFVSDDPHPVCPRCSRKMTRQLTYVDPPAAAAAAAEVVACEKGLVKGLVTYMVMDDLEVKPMSTISSITLLTKFNVKDVGALEEKVVNLGMKEAVKLLKASLGSKTVLTDVFCKFEKSG